MSDPGQAVAPLEQTLRTAAEGIHRTLVALADDIGGAAVLVTGEAEALSSRLEDALVELAAANERVRVAERHREMFRHALWLYLQERDGAAGAGAPTPETLLLIRELIGELDGVA